MKQRIMTGLAFISILIILFFSKSLTAYVFDFAICGLMIISAIEFSKILSKIGFYNHIILSAIFPAVLYAAIMIGLHSGLALYAIILIVIGLIFVSTILMFLISLCCKKTILKEIETRQLKISMVRFCFNKAIYTMFTFLYPSVMLSFLFFCNRIEMFGNFIPKIAEFKEVSLSLIVLISTFLIPIVCDSFAMLTGALFKGPKLAPKISPKKTISGFIGGIFWTTVFTCIFFFIMSSIPVYAAIFEKVSINFLHFGILGFVGALVCTAGDLFESFLKRKANVKDSGNALPGHGGFLDRFDSHIFNAPFVFFFFLIILL
ncbi:MAG: phosphatidate cytidylyltransferase [Clostridia bacterium]